MRLDTATAWTRTFRLIDRERRERLSGENP